MRIAITFLFYVITCGLLMVKFRVDEYLRNFSFPYPMTIASYLVVAVLVTSISMGIAPLVSKWLAKKESVLLTSFVSFVLLVVVSILFGPYGLDLPGIRVQGIFFSEWKFTNFIFYDALPLSIVGALLYGWSNRTMRHP
jgi:hypothetical protein